MRSSTWLWRLVSAATGVAGYWLLYRPDWREPFVLLYDVPALMLSFSLAGSVIVRFILRARQRGDGVRLALLLTMLVVALGVQYGGWPFSGHLLCALTAGILEARDVQNPGWFRLAVFAPAMLLILIRTFRPQSALMPTHAYTVSALLLGTALGSGGVAVMSGAAALPFTRGGDK